MSIIRVAAKKRHYTVITNETLQDTSISLDAKGVLVYLLSMPDNWVVYQSQLCEVLSVGKDKMQRIFKELVTAGYVKEDLARDEGSRFSGRNYTVYETRQAVAVFSGAGKAGAGKAGAGKTASTKYTQYKVITTQSNNSCPSEDGRSASEVKMPFRDDFEALWKQYPRKLRKDVAYKRYVARRREGVTHEQLLQAVGNYAITRRGKDPAFTMHASTFLTDGRWADYLDGSAELLSETMTPAERRDKQIIDQIFKD